MDPAARDGRNRYYQARLEFTRRWLQDPSADHRDLLIFECYPWHSKSITAPLKPPPEVIEEFVWQPIAELPVQDVFAFGRPWDDIAQALGLREVGRLGFGGTDYGSAVHSRAVRDLRAVLGAAAGRRVAFRLGRAAERQGDGAPPRCSRRSGE